MKKCRELNAEIVANAAKVAAALQLSEEDQAAVTAMKREVEKAWKLVDAAHEKVCLSPPPPLQNTPPPPPSLPACSLGHWPWPLPLMWGRKRQGGYEHEGWDMVVKEKWVMCMKGKRVWSVEDKRVMSMKGERVVSMRGKRVVSVEGQRVVSMTFERVVSMKGKRVVGMKGKRVMRMKGSMFLSMNGERVMTGERVLSMKGKRVMRMKRRTVMKGKRTMPMKGRRATAPNPTSAHLPCVLTNNVFSNIKRRTWLSSTCCCRLSTAIPPCYTSNNHVAEGRGVRGCRTLGRRR